MRENNEDRKVLNGAEQPLPETEEIVSGADPVAEEE